MISLLLQEQKLQKFYIEIEYDSYGQYEYDARTCYFALKKQQKNII